MFLSSSSRPLFYIANNFDSLMYHNFYRYQFHIIVTLYIFFAVFVHSCCADEYHEIEIRP